MLPLHQEVRQQTHVCGTGQERHEQTPVSSIEQGARAAGLDNEPTACAAAKVAGRGPTLPTPHRSTELSSRLVSLLSTPSMPRMRPST